MDIFNNDVFYMTVYVYGLAFQVLCLAKEIRIAKFCADKADKANNPELLDLKNLRREALLSTFCLLAILFTLKLGMFPLMLFIPFLRCLVYFGKIIVQDIEDKNSKFFIFITSVLFLFFQVLLKQ